MADQIDMPPAEAGWDKRGGWVVRALMGRYHLTREQAAGIVGNLGFESGGFMKLHEIGQPENSGGYGWAQWTAGRRRTFLAYCEDKGLDWRSDAANYGYLCTDLDGSYVYCVAKLRKAKTLDDAVFTWGRYFEVPGGTTDDYLPGFDGRLRYAQRAYEGSKAYGTEPAVPAAAPQAPGEPEQADDDDTPPTLRSGMSGDDVLDLQHRLIDLDIYCGEPDGKFGPKTFLGVAAFQRKAGLRPDGIVGPQTWAALDDAEDQLDAPC